MSNERKHDRAGREAEGGGSLYADDVPHAARASSVGMRLRHRHRAPRRRPAGQLPRVQEGGRAARRARTSSSSRSTSRRRRKVERKQIVKKKLTRKVPIPDPTPDEPEPIREPEPEIEPEPLPPDVEFLIGVPEPPPPSGPLLAGVGRRDQPGADPGEQDRAGVSRTGPCGPARGQRDPAGDHPRRRFGGRRRGAALQPAQHGVRGSGDRGGHGVAATSRRCRTAGRSRSTSPSSSSSSCTDRRVTWHGRSPREVTSRWTRGGAP